MLNNKYICKNYYSFYDDCISYFKGATATYFQTSSSQLYITHTSLQKLKPLSIELIRQEATITPLTYIYIVISIAWVSEWVSSVLRPHRHSIGYTGDGFYRSKDPTNSIKVLKEDLQKTKQQRKQLNTDIHRQ